MTTLHLVLMLAIAAVWILGWVAARRGNTRALSGMWLALLPLWLAAMTVALLLDWTVLAVAYAACAGISLWKWADHYEADASREETRR